MLRPDVLFGLLAAFITGPLTGILINLFPEERSLQRK